MAYIFLDESGDLGFDFSKKKTSKFFVVTFLFIKNKHPIERLIKNIFKRFTPLERKFHQGCLHCFKETPKVRASVLNIINEKDVSIVAIYLNKNKVYTKLQNEKHVLYNYVSNILLDRVFTQKLIPTDETINLIASKRETNKFLNENFKNYLETQVANNHKLKIKIEIMRPCDEKCLQVVDFASWAIFRKLEYADESYHNQIKSKITNLSPIFP